MKHYKVDDDVKYRREYFGGITLNVPRQETRFYNDAASMIIEHCKMPKNANELGLILSAGWTDETIVLESFLEKLVQDGVLAICDADDASDASFFYTGVQEFSKDYLYTPLGVEIELTLKCLRHCKYCAYDAHPKAGHTDELDLEAWTKTLRQLRDSGVFFVRFTGGDPLVRQDFPQLLAVADELGLLITVGSDLTTLQADHINALVKAKNLFALQTTLDGANEKTADLLRGPGNFSAVMAGIKRLNRAGVPIIVGTVLTRLNVNEIADIGRLVGEAGVDGYCVAPLYEAGRAEAKSVRDLIPTNDDLATAAKAFRKVIDEGLVQPADPAWLIAMAEIDENELNTLWKDQPYLMRRPDRLLRIDPRGRCYVSIKLKPGLNDDIYLGNIQNTDIISLWRDTPLIQKLRAMPDQETYFGRVLDVRQASL